jgi:hypothetical protein
MRGPNVDGNSREWYGRESASCRTELSGVRRAAKQSSPDDVLRDAEGDDDVSDAGPQKSQLKDAHLECQLKIVQPSSRLTLSETE